MKSMKAATAISKPPIKRTPKVKCGSWQQQTVATTQQSTSVCTEYLLTVCAAGEEAQDQAPASPPFRQA